MAAKQIDSDGRHCRHWPAPSAHLTAQGSGDVSPELGRTAMAMGAGTWWPREDQQASQAMVDGGIRRQGRLGLAPVHAPCILGNRPPTGRPELTSLKLLPSRLRHEVARQRALAEEREEFRRAGAGLALSEPGRSDDLTPLREEARRATAALAALAAERGAVAEAKARDLARVGWWVRPAVVVRALASSIVLQDDRRRSQRALDKAHEAIGRAAILGAAPAGAEVSGPVGERASEWTGHAQREAQGFTLALWGQVRGHLFPKLPALAGMAVGWWVANTYTDSRLRSALRSVGIGSGGTHVVSGSTYRAMTFWLPLLAAALCAYAGERIWERVVGRED